ncbi:MAG: DNA repair protein RecN [Sutterellaceae bacterium]|nr:DNA repair protein RecN [Burkholderiaceae bacterium]MCX7901672.1 DNA repair protein RecN [Burkholderiaceae bacterium]MDW8430168.1 DNA repair protein RecN [Sutterellaceae bacterium]
MLLSLSIRNFVLVDELELEFAPGFTVLTGETGAGKSILIDALLLALGERADASVVREGAARADVAAEFRASPAVANWLTSQQLPVEGDTVLLRRIVDASGRSRAFVNGVPVTQAQLRELGEWLVDVHGQHAHQSLLRPAAQLRLLDEHGGHAALAAEVAAAHAAWRRAQRDREQAETIAASAAAEQERLRFVVEALEELAPAAGEWETIEAEHKRLAHAAALLAGAQSAIDALTEAEGAARERIDACAARLRQLTGYDARLQPVLELLDTARAHIDEAAAELRRYLDRADLDETRLAEVEARVSALHAAARKFRVAPAELPTLWHSAREKLAALSAAADLDALRRREAAAADAYYAAARRLSEARAAAATQMSAEVTRAMQDLGMAGGRFEVTLVPAEPSGAGCERVEFLVAGHAGSRLRPLAKVASGGELSRISLAIAVIAATATPVATLIFDEVDAGVGGAVAETVGRLLKELGRHRQVLCVTHLPQVAARGDQHLRVEKEAAACGPPMTRIEPLDRKGRVDELARMLGGHAITETTRKHAREMLAA